MSGTKFLSIGENTSEPALCDRIQQYLPSNTTDKTEQKKESCLIRNSIDPLQKLCVDAIVKFFSTRPYSTRTISPRILKNLLSALPINLEPHIGADFIHCEEYWKRVCVAKYGETSCDIDEHGLTWKRLYFERLTWEKIETYDPKQDDEEQLLQYLECVQDNVVVLRINGLRQNSPLDKICSKLKNISSLNIRFGVGTNAMMNYNKDSQAASLPDAKILGASLEKSIFNYPLSSLSLTNSKVTDDFLRILVTNLGRNTIQTLSHLDISNNKVTTDGLRLLANKFLAAEEKEEIDSMHSGTVLEFLNVSNNFIQAEGGRALGRLLRDNESLLSLDIGLNMLGDKGGKMLLEGLRDNDTLMHLNISANSLGPDSFAAFTMVLEAGISRLESVNLSSNEKNMLSESELVNLSQVLKSNEYMQSLDLRGNKRSTSTTCKMSEMSKNAKVMIFEKLRVNELKNTSE